MAPQKFSTVDAYMESLNGETRTKTEQMRSILTNAFPGASEGISYNIPALSDGGFFVYFSGYKKHVSLYPAPTGVAEFEDAIAPYHTGKGTLQFPIKDPLPAELIVRVAQYHLDKLRADKAAKVPKRKTPADS